MAKIKSIKTRKILDSRSNSTIEVDVGLDNGLFGRASVPAGASMGRYEAFKLEDLAKAITNVTTLSAYLEGREISQQRKIDQIMIDIDGTPNKDNLGGNVILAISLACAEAAANSYRMPLYRYLAEIFGHKKQNLRLPDPLFNVVNGGQHADNNLPFQEFMLIPIGKDSFSEKLFLGANIYHQLKKDFQKTGLSVAVGDEGGFAPALNANEEALEFLVNAIHHCGFQPQQEVGLGLDAAASSIANLEMVTYPYEPVTYYQRLVEQYPIVLLEDPLGEDDWGNWAKLTTALGSKIKIVGDDIFTTNPARLKRGIKEGSANAIIIKPDQIGTLSETLQTIAMAKKAGFTIVVSHRSGETESTFIADLAVAVGAQFIKAGAPCRGERVAKYNRLLRIEEELT